MPITKIFENTETAFSLKSENELNRSYQLFKLMANPTLVSIGSALTKFSFNLHLPIKGIVRKTVFRQFCGGETEDACLGVIHKMHEKGIYSILDYSVEGKEDEADFEAAYKKKLELVHFAKSKKEIPFVVMKPTAIGRFDLFVKVTAKKELSDSEKKEWERVVNRFNTICKAAYDADLQVMIDAEETWMQDAVDNLVEEMMRKYNKDRVTVFCTLQCYRWDRLDYIKQLHARAKSEGFKLGAKIVRGAYMEKERERAEEKGYKSPICATKEECDNTFDDTMRYIVENLNDISLFVGTHNEASSYLAMQLIEEKNLPKNTPSIWFGQLFGMSDHITFNLAENGYNSVKLIPFGPIEEVIPYLIRRAEENTSVAGQTGRELTLLIKEKKRRQGTL